MARSLRNDTRAAISHRFGGRATASGVSYEARVAAHIAAKMLAGTSATVWKDVTGGDIVAVALQAPDAVDDVVVSFKPSIGGFAFISAKSRAGTIALTSRNRAFVDTVSAFALQFSRLSPDVRNACRFIWAVPSSAGRGVTEDLQMVLDNHREGGGTSSLQDFLRGRPHGERKALSALLLVASSKMQKHLGHEPSEGELRHLMRMAYVEVYDFERGHRHERAAVDVLASQVVGDAKDAHRAWQRLEHLIARADERGLSHDESSLRRALTADGIVLKARLDFARDLGQLRDVTARNLLRLKEHTILPFGPKPADAVHIERLEELPALLAAAKAGHLLLTGEPGCGKSGLIHALVGALQAEGFPVVLLLAEEVAGRDWRGAANVPGLDNSLNEVLSHWPDGARGFLVTDALDAVRDVEAQKMLRRLLRDVQAGKSGWTVVASVREFDLKHGRELREAFPGNSVTGHAATDFAGVAHFHLSGFSEAQLDELAGNRAEIRPFVESARRSPKSGAIHRSPFYLRLAAELLRDGVTPARLADWSSPAILLRKFWEARVEDDEGADERGAALAVICREMVTARGMALSEKEIRLDTFERKALRELRSRGILQGPALHHGTRVRDEAIRFSHHLLHDYAIARSVIPATEDRFCAFAVQEPLLPVFYRQSFMFALEELWDSDESREPFWQSAFRLESEPRLHGLTRILAPILAARRVETLSDVQLLLRNYPKTPARRQQMIAQANVRSAV